mgnify:CR=1
DKKKCYLGTIVEHFEDTLEAQNLSNKKYQTVFAKGSTIASVKATANETSATSIKTVIAIKKWPI